MLGLYLRAKFVKDVLMERVKDALKRQDGATVAEYALLLAIVVTALITVLGNLRVALEGKIQSIIDQISGP